MIASERFQQFEKSVENEQTIGALRLLDAEHRLDVTDDEFIVIWQELKEKVLTEPRGLLFFEVCAYNLHVKIIKDLFIGEVSKEIWGNLTLSARDRLYPEWQDHANEDWLYTVFLGVSDSLDSDSQTAYEDFAFALLSQVPTRRYLKTLLENMGLATCLSNSQGFNYIWKFPFDDLKGAPLGHVEWMKLRAERYQNFRQALALVEEKSAQELIFKSDKELRTSIVDVLREMPTDTLQTIVEQLELPCEVMPGALNRKLAYSIMNYLMSGPVYERVSKCTILNGHYLCWKDACERASRSLEDALEAQWSKIKSKVVAAPSSGPNFTASKIVSVEKTSNSGLQCLTSLTITFHGPLPEDCYILLVDSRRSRYVWTHPEDSSRHLAKRPIADLSGLSTVNVNISDSQGCPENELDVICFLRGKLMQQSAMLQMSTKVARFSPPAALERILVGLSTIPEKRHVDAGAIEKQASSISDSLASAIDECLTVLMSPSGSPKVEWLTKFFAKVGSRQDTRTLVLSQSLEEVLSLSKIATTIDAEAALTNLSTLLTRVSDLCDEMALSKAYAESGESALLFYETVLKRQGSIDNNTEKLFKEIEALQPLELLGSTAEQEKYLLHTSRSVALGKRQFYEYVGKKWKLDFDVLVIADASDMTVLDFMTIVASLDPAPRRTVLIADKFEVAPDSLIATLVAQGNVCYEMSTAHCARPEILRLRGVTSDEDDAAVGAPDESCNYANAGLRYTVQFIDSGKKDKSKILYSVLLYMYLRLLQYPAEYITLYAQDDEQQQEIEKASRKAIGKHTKLFGKPNVGRSTNRYVICPVVSERQLQGAIRAAQLGLYMFGDKRDWEQRVREDLQLEVGQLELNSQELYGTCTRMPVTSDAEDAPNVYVMQSVAHLQSYVEQMTQQMEEYELGMAGR